MPDREKLKARFEELARCTEDGQFATISAEDVRGVLELIRQATMAKNLLETIADHDTNWTTYIRYHLTWKLQKEEEDGDVRTLEVGQE